MIATLESRAARFRIAVVAPLQRHAAAFWRWWSGELTAMLPAAMRESLVRSKTRIFAQVSGEELQLFRGTIERMQALAAIPIDGGGRSKPEPGPGSKEVTLLLPPDMMLDPIVTLPAATEENLYEVLAFEMDRITPFTSDQVYYGFSVTKRSPRSGTIDVRLLVARRETVDRLLAALERSELLVRAVTAKDADGALHDINLLPGGRNAESGTIVLRRVNRGLGIVAVLLLVAVVALPLLQKYALVDDLETRVATATEAAREGSRLKRSIEAMVSGSAALAARKEAQPMMVAIIDEMSRILPDNTWLTRIDVSGSEVQIQGQSTSAAALIGLIEQSPYFEQAQFRSPVVQDTNQGSERFHLSAEWKQPR